MMMMLWLCAWNSTKPVRYPYQAASPDLLCESALRRRNRESVYGVFFICVPIRVELIQCFQSYQRLQVQLFFVAVLQAEKPFNVPSVSVSY
jgi:hypothetical protein